MTTSMQCSVTEVWTDAAPALGRLVRAMSLDSASSDDVLQDVYVAALQQCPEGLDPKEIRRWLFRVTVNRCNLEHRHGARRARTHARFAQLMERSASADHSPSEAERLESIELVRTSLAVMDPEMHMLLVLRYFVQLDSKEIGAILEMPDSTVRSHLRKARLELARHLEKAGYEHDD